MAGVVGPKKKKGPILNPLQVLPGGKQTGQEWIWPLELVWLVDGCTKDVILTPNFHLAKTGFDIVGPNKTLSVMGDSKENKDQWFNSLKTHIETTLLRQPNFNRACGCLVNIYLFHPPFF